MFMCVLCTFGSFCGGRVEAAGETFRIGFIYSKTGRLAPYAKSVSQGAKLALQLFRAEYPQYIQSVQMIAADDESSASGATKAGTRLLSKQEVDILVGSFSNTLNYHLLALSKQYRIPLLMPRATDEMFLNQALAFSITPDDKRQGRMLAQFILKHLKLKQASLLIETDRLDTNRLLAGFQEEWAHDGASLLGQWDFKPGQAALGPLFHDMATQKPPIIVFLGAAQHAPLILDRAKQNGIQAPWLGGDAWDNESLLALAPELPSAFFFSYFHKLDPQSSVQSFVQAYYDAYNAFPDQLAAEGFEATKIALEAFLIQQKGESQDLRKILETNSFQGIFGNAHFAADHTLLHAHPFFRAQDGKLRVLNRITLQD